MTPALEFPRHNTSVLGKTKGQATSPSATTRNPAALRRPASAPRSHNAPGCGGEAPGGGGGINPAPASRWRENWHFSGGPPSSHHDPPPGRVTRTSSRMAAAVSSASKTLSTAPNCVEACIGEGERLRIPSLTSAAARPPKRQPAPRGGWPAAPGVPRRIPHRPGVCPRSPRPHRQPSDKRHAHLLHAGGLPLSTSTPTADAECLHHPSAFPLAFTKIQISTYQPPTISDAQHDPKHSSYAVRTSQAVTNVSTVIVIPLGTSYMGKSLHAQPKGPEHPSAPHASAPGHRSKRRSRTRAQTQYRHRASGPVPPERHSQTLHKLSRSSGPRAHISCR